MTNGDKIRGMDDAGLARFFIFAGAGLDDEIPFCKNREECVALLDGCRGIPEGMCESCMEEWLGRETGQEERKGQVRMTEEKYTIGQIIDAVTQADEEMVEAVRYKDRDMLEDVLKDYLH